MLPLKSLDAGDNYLGLGIADAVIRRTSQTGGMIVRPTSAIQRYMTEDLDALTAARQLSTDVVLEGSVQRAGERLRVSVNLLRVGDGASLWAEVSICARPISSRSRIASRARSRRTCNSGSIPRSKPGWAADRPRSASVRVLLKDCTGSISGCRSASRRRPARSISSIGQLKRTPISRSRTPTRARLRGRRRLPSAGGARDGRASEGEIARAQALDPDLPEIALARAALLGSRFGGFRGDEAVRVLLTAQRIDANVGHAELTYHYAHLGLAELAERAGERAWRSIRPATTRNGH